MVNFIFFLKFINLKGVFFIDEKYKFYFYSFIDFEMVDYVFFWDFLGC